MKKPLIKLFAVLGFAAVGNGAQATEEPAFTLVRQYEGFEIRHYAPYLVAEVTVPGPADEAGNQGFKVLAGYIFGKNKGERKIAMTAPVTQSPVPAKIAMTAPVMQSASDKGFVIQFTMPAGFTLDTLPEPVDNSIRLREVPGSKVAVIRYSGSWSDANYSEHLARLRSSAEAAGIAVRGEPVYARYNAPYVPWFLRRNEIWLPLPE